MTFMRVLQYPSSLSSSSSLGPEGHKHDREVYKIGGMAICPSHGLARIKAIESRQIQGKEERFYVLDMVDTGARIMVPLSSSSSMREVSSLSDIEKVFAILKTPRILSVKAWNRRFRELSDKIGCASIVQVAEALRDLWIIQMQKELSFNEKLLLTKAMKLLCEEVSASKDVAYDEAEKSVDCALQVVAQSYVALLDEDPSALS